LTGLCLLGMLPVLAVVLGCAGLQPSLVDDRANLTDHDVIGTWHSGLGGVFVFNTDGTFTAKDLLNEVFDDYQRPGPRRSGDGTWKRQQAREDPTGPFQQVDLTFHALSDWHACCGGWYGSELDAKTSGGSIVLLFYIGDPDGNDLYQFTKDQSTTNAPTPLST
jgi:hypothetical protein